MTGLAWHGVALVFIELVAMLMSLVAGAPSPDSSDDEDPTA